MDSRLTSAEEAILARWEAMPRRNRDDLQSLAPNGASDTLLREIALVDFELRWRAFNRRFAKDQPPQFEETLALLASAGFSVEASEQWDFEAFYIVSLLGSEADADRFLASSTQRLRIELQQAYAAAQNERIAPYSVTDSSPEEIDYHELVFERMIGRGGSGRVYLARRRSAAGKVAVKALYRRLQQDPFVVAMFEQEAKTLQRFQHPHIVQFLGLGRFPSGGLFLTLEYVDGGTLAEAIQGGSIRNQQKREHFLAIATAVEHAHQVGVTHGDLKPQNILLTKSGEVRIADFGLAQLASETHFGVRGGTVGYMAPEELQREGDREPSADLYALGGVLYFLVTGNDPRDELTPIAEGNHEIMAIVQRCRELEVAKRYPSVAALINDIAKLNPTAF